jgi:hypothetical protein
MPDCTIYALKADDPKTPNSWAPRVYEDLRRGVARYGWSNFEKADLRRINDKIKGPGGWNSLDEDEQDTWNVNFLLNITPGDYVVYINMPEYGKCTLARVSKPYWFEWGPDGDFNHRLGIDADSLKTFDRNDEVVRPKLSARLKLQGRWWHINAKNEFEYLLDALKVGLAGRLITAESAFLLLEKEVEPFLEDVVRKIQETHPAKKLEAPVANMLRKVPGITAVQELRGGQDVIGADITFDYEVGLPIPGWTTPGRCAVQVKSYEDVMDHQRAIEDIRKAFSSDPSFTSGLIISTALSTSTEFDQARDALEAEFKKPVQVLLGTDFARFFLKYGARGGNE